MQMSEMSEACVMEILTVVGARPNFMKAAPMGHESHVG